MKSFIRKVAVLEFMEETQIIIHKFLDQFLKMNIRTDSKNQMGIKEEVLMEADKIGRNLQ